MIDLHPAHSVREEFIFRANVMNEIGKNLLPESVR